MKPMKLALAALAAVALGAAAPATAATVVASAYSASFRLDTREGSRTIIIQPASSR